MSGRITEIAGGSIITQVQGDMAIYAETIHLHAADTVKWQGNEKGVYLGNKPETPKLEFEESAYKLESTFALEQLFAFAAKDSKAMFCFWMTGIFGADISITAYEQLYQDASNKKQQLNPRIVVAVALPGKGAAYLSDPKSPFKNHIVISQGFIEQALLSQTDAKLLLLALVEEFGHHLDYLLRTEYSKTGGDAAGDEGARYTGRMNRAYRKYYIDAAAGPKVHYATATLAGEQKELVWDFSDLNQLLKAYVDHRTEKEDHHFAGYEFFSAGMGDDTHGLGHQALEEAALAGIFDRDTRSKIYLGNWLRDFSQFVDPMVVRPMANALDRISGEYKAAQNKDKPEMSLEELKTMFQENRVTSSDRRTVGVPINISITEARIDWEATALSPVKLSRAGITTLVEMLAVKEFGSFKVKAADPKAPPDYTRYLKAFRKKHFEITPEILGVYRPEEHIDNPAALFPKAGAEADLNYKLDPAFVKDPVEGQYQTSAFGTKNYIRGNGPAPFPSAYDCFRSFLNRALSSGPTTKGYTDLGAAFHILEDLYAHSNFCELAVMKVYDPEVFPWENLPAGCRKGTLKAHKADAASNRHAGRASAISNPGKVQFNTLINPELHPAPVQAFLRQNPSKRPEDYYSAAGGPAGNNRGLYYSHAACAPLVTGSFGPLDTIASITPKINNKLFSIEVKPIENVQEGERSFTDALIYELLRDISQAQDADEKERNPAYKGRGDGKYAAVFQQYLLLRDAYVADRWYLMGYSWQNVLSGFGILDYLTDYIRVIQSVLYHTLALTAINLIDDYQTLALNQLDQLEQGTWRVAARGPTHTQLAKDNGLQPFHLLAIDLAKDAVKSIALEVDRFWKGDGSARARAMAKADEFFRHPVQTAWADHLVYNWCSGSAKNRGLTLIAHEASVAIYGIYQGHREMQELFDNLYKLNFWNAPEKINDPNNIFRKLYDAQTSKWHRVQQRLFEVWKSDRFAESLRDSGVSERLSTNKILEELQTELQQWIP